MLLALLVKFGIVQRGWTVEPGKEIDRIQGFVFCFEQWIAPQPLIKNRAGYSGCFAGSVCSGNCFQSLQGIAFQKLAFGRSSLASFHTLPFATRAYRCRVVHLCASLLPTVSGCLSVLLVHFSFK